MSLRVVTHSINSNFEYRNPKQIRTTKIQMTKTRNIYMFAQFSVLNIGTLGF
jgi:hypothetical protein